MQKWSICGQSVALQTRAEKQPVCALQGMEVEDGDGWVGPAAADSSLGQSSRVGIHPDCTWEAAAEPGVAIAMSKNKVSQRLAFASSVAPLRLPLVDFTQDRQPPKRGSLCVYRLGHMFESFEASIG